MENQMILDQIRNHKKDSNITIRESKTSYIEIRRYINGIMELVRIDKDSYYYTLSMAIVDGKFTDSDRWTLGVFSPGISPDRGVFSPGISPDRRGLSYNGHFERCIYQNNNLIYKIGDNQ